MFMMATLLPLLVPGFPGTAATATLGQGARTGELPMASVFWRSSTALVVRSGKARTLL